MPRIEHITENDIEKKHCGKCKIYKSLEVFGNSCSSWDGLRTTCKECLKLENIQNKDKKTEYNKKYWEETKELQSEKCKKWRENNKEHVKENMKKWYENNKEHKKEKDKEYRIKNWDKKKIYNAEWKRKNYKNMKENPDRKLEFAEYKVKTNTSRRIREMLGQKKSDRTMHYVGCSLEELRKHLETKFLQNISWDNYGETVEKNKVDAWHIDHMIPCTAFNLNNELEARACFHYTNLQPLWATDNIQKHGNYTKEDKEKYMKEYLEKYSNININELDELEYDSQDNLEEISNESNIIFLENKLINNLIPIQT